MSIVAKPVNSQPQEIVGRKKAVLKAVVDTYVQDCVPVSSKKITENSFKEYSSATIRNDLAHLEESGLLFQTHVSSGRIPTDQGYRFFVDNFVDETKQSIPIDSQSQVSNTTLGSVLENTVQLISTHTKMTAIALESSNVSRVISDLHLTRLRDSRYVLGIFFDDSNVDRLVFSVKDIIHNTKWETIPKIIDEQIDRFILIFKEKINGLDINKLISSEIVLEISPNNEVDQLLLHFLIGLLTNSITTNSGEENIYLAGTSAITQNKTSVNVNDDIEISSQLLSLIEQQMQLADIVRQSLSSKVSVKIGHENLVDEMSHHSLVLAPINISDHNAGAVGVLGPTRMDYNQIFGLLSYASDIVSEKIENMEK